MLGFVLIFATYYASLLLFSGVRERHARHIKYTRASAPPLVEKTDIVYKGHELGISDEEIHHILSKHQHYYKTLHYELQKEFLFRLQSFMKKKVFVIKDDEIFKEMPVLVSAAAIQLSFGLKDFHYSFYRYIRIQPSEYIADHSFKILAGNVSNNTITVAWNHFLHGYAHHTDGSNLGLHEMSHALYFQKLVIDGKQARTFCRKYKGLVEECNQAFVLEKSGKKDFYSGYAETDLQEFWAETVELFFEKPLELCASYPAVYQAMKSLLNQDTMNPENPIVETSPKWTIPIDKLLGRV